MPLQPLVQFIPNGTSSPSTLHLNFWVLKIVLLYQKILYHFFLVHFWTPTIKGSKYGFYQALMTRALAIIKWMNLTWNLRLREKLMVDRHYPAWNFFPRKGSTLSFVVPLIFILDGNYRRKTTHLALTIFYRDNDMVGTLIVVNGFCHVSYGMTHTSDMTVTSLSPQVCHFLHVCFSVPHDKESRHRPEIGGHLCPRTTVSALVRGRGHGHRNFCNRGHGRGHGLQIF